MVECFPSSVRFEANDLIIKKIEGNVKIMEIISEKWDKFGVNFTWESEFYDELKALEYRFHLEPEKDLFLTLTMEKKNQNMISFLSRCLPKLQLLGTPTARSKSTQVWNPIAVFFCAILPCKVNVPFCLDVILVNVIQVTPVPLSYLILAY